MRSVSELLGRRPTEIDQKKDQAGKLFSQIVELAPQIGYDYFTSDSLGRRLSSNAEYPHSHLIDSVHIKDGDPLNVSWSKGTVYYGGIEGPLMIRDNRSGKDFGIQFDRKTFGMKGVVIGGEFFPKGNQQILNRLLEVLKDDLEERRSQWKEVRLDERDEFYGNIKGPGDDNVSILDMTLDTLSHLGIEDDIAIFGEIELSRRRRQRINLYTTTPVRTDMVEGVRILIPNIEGREHKKLAYEFRVPGSDSERLVLEYPTCQVIIEDFFPGSVTAPGEKLLDPTLSRLPKPRASEVLEKHFSNELAGTRAGFYPGRKPDAPRLTLLAFKGATPFGDVFQITPEKNVDTAA